MPDYKELCFTMVQETEKAVQILIKAQQLCEERYLAKMEEETLE